MAFWVKDSSGLEVCDFRFRLDPALESARNSEGGAFPDLDARIQQGLGVFLFWGCSSSGILCLDASGAADIGQRCDDDDVGNASDCET